MDHVSISLNMSDAETAQVKRLTNCSKTEAAIAKLVTLAGRGRLTVKPSNEQYARALRESLADEAAGRMRTFKTATAAMKYIRRKVAG